MAACSLWAWWTGQAIPSYLYIHQGLGHRWPRGYHSFPLLSLQRYSNDAPTAAAGVSINGGVGVGVGEGSSVPVKKPVVIVEVVSIIESVCNATGIDTSLLLSVKEMCRLE